MSLKGQHTEPSKHLGCNSSNQGRALSRLTQVCTKNQGLSPSLLDSCFPCDQLYFK